MRTSESRLGRCGPTVRAVAALCGVITTGALQAQDDPSGANRPEGGRPLLEIRPAGESG